MTLFDTISKYFPRRYTRQILPDMTGTICVPWRVKERCCFGADFYKIKEGSMDLEKFSLEPVQDLEAGVPYIFQSNGSTKLCLWHNGFSVDEPKNMNGLYGTFKDLANEEIEGCYLLTEDGKFTKADGHSSL